MPRHDDLLRAVLAIGSDLEPEPMLHRIVESAVGLVGARFGALGVLDEEGVRLAQFVTVGVSEATHRAIGTFLRVTATMVTWRIPAPHRRRSPVAEVAGDDEHRSR